MTSEELKELRKAIKSVSREDHSLYIEGESFTCEYKNGKFIWTAPSGTKYTLNRKEVLQYVHNGEYVKYFSYDYTEETQCPY